MTITYKASQPMLNSLKHHSVFSCHQKQTKNPPPLPLVSHNTSLKEENYCYGIYTADPDWHVTRKAQHTVLQPSYCCCSVLQCRGTHEHTRVLSPLLPPEAVLLFLSAQTAVQVFVDVLLWNSNSTNRAVHWKKVRVLSLIHTSQQESSWKRVVEWNENPDFQVCFFCFLIKRQIDPEPFEPLSALQSTLPILCTTRTHLTFLPAAGGHENCSKIIE